MATGSLDANGIWLYGEDDSETTFSGLLNKLASSTSNTVTRLEGFTGITGTLPVVNGGTGATTVSAAQSNLNISILQTLSTTRNSYWVTASTSWVEVPSFSVTITPKYSTSKFLVNVSGTFGYSAAGWVGAALVRNGTYIGLNDTGTGTHFEAPRSDDDTHAFNIQYLDSPGSTAAQTYTLRLKVEGNTAVLGTAWNGGYAHTSITTMTVMEIKA